MSARPHATPQSVTAALERALAHRRDHARYIGLTTRRAAGRSAEIILEWRDALTQEHGLLAKLPPVDCQPVIAATLAAIGAWREQCAP